MVNNAQSTIFFEFYNARIIFLFKNQYFNILFEILALPFVILSIYKPVAILFKLISFLKIVDVFSIDSFLINLPLTSKISI